jgi:hypothetical protein
METTAKYFFTQKKKISMMLIFSNNQISNNSRFESSDVTGFPFSRRSIWRPKLTCLQCWARGNTKPPSQACVCLSATITRTWRWNILGQVRLISGPRFCHSQTVCARDRGSSERVSSSPRPALGARTFQVRCDSFRDLISVTNRLSMQGDRGSSEHVSLRHHDPHLVLEHLKPGAAHFTTSTDRRTNRPNELIYKTMSAAIGCKLFTASLWQLKKWKFFCFPSPGSTGNMKKIWSLW